MANCSVSPALTLEPLAADQRPLVDLRSPQAFVQGHPLGATNIPLEELPLAWHELPPKGARLELLVNQADAEQAQRIFEQQQYAIEQIRIAEQQDQASWLANNVSQRLWRANPLLEHYIELIKQHIHSSSPVAFDIGCGSGRDALFLALHGFKVLGLDNNPFALERLEQFKRRWNANLSAKIVDFQTQRIALVELIEQQQPSLVVQARYLHRPLLDDFYQYLPAGSILAIHTFLEAAAKFGKPKNPAYLLKNNELAEKFKGWDLLINQEHRLDDGRPLSLFLAKKP
ncbi:tellurite resistance methyltransferase TehB [Kangiella sp. TOML190]|uniref:tellurite resistance methyltransferase TehB n=1 Tax=Kangiella sp. TOML190 TaxID=2931351 RepID=UPI00203E6C44|nr:tellurite resistance methyltransferase TehB [Kangiella sp. TOML190]